MKVPFKKPKFDDRSQYEEVKGTDSFIFEDGSKGFSNIRVRPNGTQDVAIIRTSTVRHAESSPMRRYKDAKKALKSAK